MSLEERYELGAQLYASAETRVVRARRRSDGERVILKTFADPYPSPSAVARYERERAILSSLAERGARSEAASVVPLVLDLEVVGHSRALVFRDQGTESLARTPAPLSIRDFFTLARGVIAALRHVHEARVIHKDVTPANVVLHLPRGLVQLIDFGLATELAREVVAPSRPALLEGTLHYISPEQTGRMNRGIDYRTDFYGLGATLHYALTGKTLFAASDPLELVHCHLARIPPLAHEVRPGVPEGLSHVVHKLLAKAPEDRYQSLEGLEHDLRRCERDLAEGRGAPFALGEEDFSDRFVVPEKLYGRERELAEIEGAFEDACQGPGAEGARGRTLLVLLPGAPGVGKSSLIRALEGPVTARRGLVATGKFDQLARGTPYSAVLHAFRELLRQVLAEDAALIEGLRADLREGLGESAGLLTSVLPELAHLVDLAHSHEEDGAEPALTGLEAQNRFRLAFERLIAALARPARPLVLVLDDLQWADLDSITLLATLSSSRTGGHCMIVGAYRDSEVTAQSPLLLAIEDARSKGAEVRSIELRSLAHTDVLALLCDALKSPAEEVLALAKVCFERTRGNAFHVHRVLRQLHRDGSVTYDRPARRFRIPLEALAKLPPGDDVIALMTAAIEGLPPATRRLVQLAACIGSEHDLDTLVAISGMGRRAVSDALLPALHEGLIEPQSGAYRAVADDDDSRSVGYRFAHDRVQQAAYAGIPRAELASVHRVIGMRLLERLRESGDDLQIFEVAHHLHQGASLAIDRASRDEIIDLDLRAARRAMQASAFAQAWALLRSALEIHRGEPEEPASSCFERDYARSLELTTLGAEAASLAGDLEVMERLVRDVEDHGRTLLDKVRARDIRVVAYVLRGRQEDAIRAGFRYLRDLGVHFPDTAGDLHALGAIARARLALGGRAPEDLVSQPAMTDPAHRAAMRTLMTISSSVYVLRPKLVPLVAMRQAELSFRHGRAPETPYAYVTYGLIVAAVLGDVALGARFGRVALGLAARAESAHLRARITMMVSWLTDHWVSPLKESSDLARRAWMLGVASGDLEYAMYSAVARTTYNLFGARGLIESVSESRGMLELARRSGVGVAVTRIGSALAAMALLTDESAEDITALRAEGFDGQAMVDEPETADPQALFVVRVIRALFFFLDERHSEAATELAQSKPLLGNYVGAFLVPIHQWLEALVHAARLSEMRALEQVQTRARIELALTSLRKLARVSPSTYAHRVALLEAERDASLGAASRAADAFDRAIELARRAAFPNDEALVCERAARFYRTRGRETVARAYLRDAAFAWRSWGAAQRARVLRERLGTERTRALQSISSSQGISDEVVSEAFDVAAVLHSAQAIADETDLSRLLSRVMTAVLEHAGARRGSLVIDEQGVMRVRATMAAGEHASEDPRAVLGLRSEAESPVPAALVRRVLQRSDPLVLDDASATEHARDPWVLARRARSLLVMGLERQGRTVGALVLENELAPSAFTPERLQALRVIAGQAAIAIDNAVLQSGLSSALAAQVELNEANQRFVPREFLAALGHETIAKVALGDSVQKELSILFSDMRGFTAHVEGYTPEQNIAFINEFLAHMEPAILAHGGFVDSYIGDAIMALFDGSGGGAPGVWGTGSADRAVRAGIEMLRNLQRYNADRAARGEREVQIGIGIHTGVVTLGTIGGPQRIKCGVIGDAVNLAARVESLTKTYRMPLLITESTLARLESPASFATREVDRVRVLGRAAAVVIHEVFDADPDERRARKLAAARAWAEALREFSGRRFQAALDGFDGCAALLRDDPAWALRRSRAASYAQHPPPPSWDGVEELARK